MAPYRPRQLSAATVTALLIAALFASPVSSATPTPFDRNLLKNPGAEDGQGTGGYAQVEIPHWTHTAPFTVVRYGAPQFPTKSESDRIGGGDKFFSCGPDADYGAIHQTIPIKGRRKAIDGGHVRVTLSARIAGFDSQGDEGRVVVRFLHGEDALASLSTPYVAATDGKFKLERKSMIVPATTQTMEVSAIGITDPGNGGAYCDAYFDNLSVRLTLV